jgi:Tol biopolymer transport system component
VDGAAMGASGGMVSGRGFPSRRRRRSLILATGVALACVLGGTFASWALAIYGPSSGGFGAEIVSVDNASDEQANAATTDAAISGNGRYVVFQTRATNFFEDDGESPQEQQAAEPRGTLREGGIFRYDRDTGQLQIVASGNLVVSEGPGAGKVLVRGAQNPSVSANGRYVAFATAAQLALQDNNHNLDVYVRDMEVPIGSEPKTSGAYTLVSAQNGSESPPVYDDSSLPTPIPGGDPGTQLWPNTSISANGRYVLFRTAEVKSSLPEGTNPETEPNQLFVRDLQDRTTTLVTRTPGGLAAAGAEGPATISADGSTVSWVGAHATEQTTFLPGENPEEQLPYYLWRRWQEVGAPTRRVTGIADPEDPSCPPETPIELNPAREGPCYGPLSFQEGRLAEITVQAPGLSADGREVAFLAGSEMRPLVTKPDALDLFLTSMAPGVTRKAGTKELTLASRQNEGDSSASITSIALSSDGTHIAFVTQRNVFSLPEPQLVGSVSADAKQDELYIVDLGSDRMERAVIGVGEAEPDGSTANNPTLSENGSTVAFVSQASNLIAGDANGFADAFAASLQSPTGVSPPPAEVNAVQTSFAITTAASPELGVHIKSGRNGQLLLLVETPGAGRLTVQARATITSGKGRKAKRRRVVVAHVAGAARSEGTTTLVLSLSRPYAALLSHGRKLRVSLAVHFLPPPPAEALSAETSGAFAWAGGAKKK